MQIRAQLINIFLLLKINEDQLFRPCNSTNFNPLNIYFNNDQGLKLLEKSQVSLTICLFPQSTSPQYLRSLRSQSLYEQRELVS